MSTNKKPTSAIEQTDNVLSELFSFVAPHYWHRGEADSAQVAATIFAAVTNARALDRLTAAVKENSELIRDKAAPKKMIRTPEEQDRDIT